MAKKRKKARTRRTSKADADDKPKKTLLERATAELEVAESELVELLADDLGEIEGVKLRSLQAAKVHRLRSTVLFEKGEDEAAAREATLADRAEITLIRAGKADVVTRVEELEARVEQARTGGKGVRALYAQKRLARPPGHDPRGTD